MAASAPQPAAASASPAAAATPPGELDREIRLARGGRPDDDDELVGRGARERGASDRIARGRCLLRRDAPDAAQRPTLA